MDTREQRRRDRERRRVQCERGAGAHGQHQRGADRRADHDREVHGQAGQRLRFLNVVIGNGLRDQAGVGGIEECPRGAEQRLDHDQLHHARAAGEDQDREGHVQSRADAVGADHDPAPPRAAKPVGPDAAEQDQRDHRQRLCGQHETEVGRRPGPLGHVQRERDDHDLVADARRRLAQEQVSEVGEAQDAQVHTHDNSLSSERKTTASPRARDRRTSWQGQLTQMNLMASIAA
jgi:hypothetical protein